MKVLILLLVTLFSLPAVPPELDRAEAQKAFVLLNKIRAAPAAFTEEMPFLAEISKKHLLRWNDTLAKVAEDKALDMAT